MPLKVIVIGGVAAGPKAASKIMRLNPQAEVTIIEKGKFISYGVSVMDGGLAVWPYEKLRG